MLIFNKLNKNSKYQPPGFSVWEIVIVLAIIGILALIAVPQFSKDRKKPPMTPSILTEVDNELAKLEWQQMAYTAPNHMELGSTATVKVVIGGNKTFDELVSLLENAGKIEGLMVQVSDKMEAQLTGRGFEIITNTPEIQLVSTLQTTNWQWIVKAKDLGNQKLYLSLNALLTVNNQLTKKSINTFQREIIVQVTSVGGIWAFIERYWTYFALLLTAVLIPLFVHLWKKVDKDTKAKKKGRPNKSVQRTPKKRRR